MYEVDTGVNNSTLEWSLERKRISEVRNGTQGLRDEDDRCSSSSENSNTILRVSQIKWLDRKMEGLRKTVKFERCLVLDENQICQLFRAHDIKPMMAKRTVTVSYVRRTINDISGFGMTMTVVVRMHIQYRISDYPRWQSLRIQDDLCSSNSEISINFSHEISTSIPVWYKCSLDTLMPRRSLKTQGYKSLFSLFNSAVRIWIMRKNLMMTSKEDAREYLQSNVRQMNWD